MVFSNIFENSLILILWPRSFPPKKYLHLLYLNLGSNQRKRRKKYFFVSKISRERERDLDPVLLLVSVCLWVSEWVTESYLLGSSSALKSSSRRDFPAMSDRPSSPLFHPMLEKNPPTVILTVTVALTATDFFVVPVTAARMLLLLQLLVGAEEIRQPDALSLRRVWGRGRAGRNWKLPWPGNRDLGKAMTEGGRWDWWTWGLSIFFFFFFSNCWWVPNGCWLWCEASQWNVGGRRPPYIDVFGSRWSCVCLLLLFVKRQASLDHVKIDTNVFSLSCLSWFGMNSAH